MKPVILTKSQAKKIILHAAGLSNRAQFGKGKEAVFRFIDHIGFVQVDTNYVVERAHHHAIATRVPDYKPEWLDQLQEEGRIFEFWTYASGYIPIRYFRFSLPVKESFLARRKPMTQTEVNLMRKILDRISREGPLMAKDFENDRVTKSSGWWDWRPSKLALERLHLEGKLTTLRKRNFHKVYDLTENIIPADVDMTTPDRKEFARHVIKTSLRALGIAYGNEIGWSAKYVKNSVKEELRNLVDEGQLVNVEVAGLKGSPLYMLSEYKGKKIAMTGDAFILSPFDVVNFFRKRLKDFFDFDYQIECFVPEAKRKYGYFSLPVLIGDTFIARMDCKADRKEHSLTVNNLHFEKVEITKPMVKKFCKALNDFAEFNQCNKIVIVKSNDKSLLKTIRDSID